MMIRRRGVSRVLSTEVGRGRGGRGGGRGRGRGRDRGERDLYPQDLNPSKDYLEAGLRRIDNIDGKAFRKLKKGDEIPVETALEEFLDKVDKLKGAPMTISYRPQQKPEYIPEARTIEELVAYVETTPYVDLEVLGQQRPEIQDAVHKAWHALARNPYPRETEKRMMMDRIYHWLMLTKDNDLLDRLMTIPKTDDPNDFDFGDLPFKELRAPPPPKKKK